MRDDGQRFVSDGDRHGRLPYASKYIALDLNGDGLSDVASVDYRFGKIKISNNAVVGTTPTAFINTGHGFRARDLANHPGFPASEALVSDTTPLGVADLNKDGLDDLLILSKDPRVPVPAGDPVPGWFYPSNGNGLSLPSPLPPIVNAGDLPFRVLDFNGDGRPDLLTMKRVIDEHGPRYEFRIYRNDQPRSLLTGMFGGLNDPPSAIEYDAVGKVARSGPGGANCNNTYPLHCPPVGPLVVTKVYRMERDLGETGTLETYTYSGPEMDLRGRGWLGVKNRRVVRTPINNPSHLLTVQDTQYGANLSMTIAGSLFNYDYPRAQKPVGEITYHVGHGEELEGTASAIGVGTTYTTVGTGASVALVPAVIITKKRTVSNFQGVLANMSLAFDPNEWPPSGAADFMTSRWSGVPDSFGNLTSIQTKTNLNNGTQVTQTVLSQFLNDQEHWLIGRPTSRTVTETTPQGSATRSWVFTPDPATGLLAHETYQSGVSDEQLDTDYGRNSSGLPIRVTRTIATGESRTANIVYDDFDGTFVKQISNSLGQRRPARITRASAFWSPRRIRTVCAWLYVRRTRSVAVRDRSGRRGSPISFRKPRSGQR